MERLSLKNIEFSERMSEETNAYVADVYLDGQKVGYAKNDGHGGETFIQAYPEKRQLLQEAEKYAESLPPVQSGNFSLKMDLPFACDILLENHLENKEVKKLMAKSLVLKKDGEIYTQTVKTPIKKLLETGVGRNYLLIMIVKAKKDGYEILNTNLTGIDLQNI